MSEWESKKRERTPGRPILNQSKRYFFAVRSLLFDVNSHWFMPAAVKDKGAEKETTAKRPLQVNLFMVAAPLSFKIPKANMKTIHCGTRLPFPPKSNDRQSMQFLYHSLAVVDRSMGFGSLPIHPCVNHPLLFGKITLFLLTLMQRPRAKIDLLTLWLLNALSRHFY